MITKLITSDNEKEFEDDLNKAIEVVGRFPKMKIKEIKFSTSSSINGSEWSALIILEEITS